MRPPLIDLAGAPRNLTLADDVPPPAARVGRVGTGNPTRRMRMGAPFSSPTHLLHDDVTDGNPDIGRSDGGSRRARKPERAGALRAPLDVETPVTARRHPASWSGPRGRPPRCSRRARSTRASDVRLPLGRAPC